MTIEYVNSNLPGAQAIGKLYLNDQKLAGMAAQGEFDELELDDIYTAINNRKYERNVLLGNTLATYTNWSHLESGSGYGIWKYPITVFTDDDNNELYRNDVKLSYQGAAASESTTAGFTKNYLSNSKRSGETFTDITTEAATSSGTPFNLAVSTSYTSAVTPVASGLNLDYTNILLGSVSVQTLASVSSYVSYSEDTDYEISYTSGVITLLSGTSITGAVQMSYNVGSTLYTGLSGATFGGISVGLAQRGVGNVYVYDYYLSGTGWTSFSPDPDGTNGYSNDGNITFSGLTGWGSTTVNSQDLYWVRQRFTTPGIILPTGWYILQAGSSVGTLLSLTSKEIKENSFKWCYYNDNIYVAIPSAGASNQEGNLYLKSTSATTNKQNYFVYNNVYMTNYRNTTTASGISVDAGNLTGTVLASGVITSSLTTVGTIGTGVWQGTAISTTYLANTSGTNTGDEDLSGYATLSGAAFTGSISATNLSGTNTGDQTLSGYATLSGATFTGPVSTRITPRVTTITTSSSPTINTDNCDAVTITALASGISSMTTNLTGTPVNFDKLTIRILDDGTARAITWGASFQAMGVALPTTTTASKVLTVGFIYDSVDSKWGCVASISEA